MPAYLSVCLSVCLSILLATSSVMAGGAGRHWAYERLVAVGLLGLVPAAFVAPAAVVNYSLAVLVPLHGHWCVCVCVCVCVPNMWFHLCYVALMYFVCVCVEVGRGEGEEGGRGEGMYV